MELFVQSSFFTGIANAEQWGLLWDDVNLDDGTISINHNWDIKEMEFCDTKNKFRSRKIEITYPVHEALKYLKDKNPGSRFVFPGKDGKPISEYMYRSNWKKTLDQLGIKHKKFYATRHTYISVLLTIGMNPEYIRERSGHNSLAMITKHYGKLIDMSQGDIEEAREFWTKKLPNGREHQFIKSCLNRN